MFGDILQPTHLIFILLVALIFLGPKRLPEAGRALGKGIRDFRGALSGITDDTSFQMPAVPSASQAPASVVTPVALHPQPAASPDLQPTTGVAADAASSLPAPLLASGTKPEAAASPYAAGWVQIESTDPSRGAD